LFFILALARVCVFIWQRKIKRFIMEALLRPDIGLMFWTIFIFVLLVALLGRFAWKPLLHSLEERERRLRAEREAAEQARSAAEKLKSELEGRLSIIKEEAQSAMEAAFSDGAKSRDAIIEEAKQQAVGMIERAKREMEAEKQRLMGDMRGSRPMRARSSEQ